MKEDFQFDEKNKRTLEYLGFKNIKLKDLFSFLKDNAENKAEISYEALRRFYSQKMNLKIDSIKYILTPFNDYDLDYILKGEGEMISMEGKSTDENFINEPNGKYGKDGVTQLAEESHMEVEFRDLSVAAGSLTATDPRQPKKTLLVPREYDKGEYLVVRVDGPSMDDGSIYSIPNGANILIKRIYLENGDKLPIRDNLFVIDAKDGQALKQIVEHNTEEGYIVCHSYNSEFNDYRVDLADVFGFYVFRKIVGFRPPVRGIS